MTGRAGATVVTDTDLKIGLMIREARWTAGMTQQQLAEAIGVTYQQINKYEKGKNRISCGSLYLIAQALGVPVTSLFPDRRVSFVPPVQIAFTAAAANLPAHLRGPLSALLRAIGEGAA